MRSFFLIAATILLLLPVKAGAFSITPLKKNLTIDPGKEQIVDVTVKNTDSQISAYSARIGGAHQNENGSPVFEDGYDDAEYWLRPGSQDFSLRPGEQKKIFFTIKAPADALPGTHTAAILIKEKSNQGISNQLAVLMTITVAGLVREELNLDVWRFNPTFLFQKAVLKNTLILKNNGTVDVPVSGKMVFNPLIGGKIYEKNLSLGNRLLPGTSRNLELPVDTKLYPGVYKVDLSVKYGRSNSVVSATQTLWYVPWWLILSVFSAIVIVIFSIRGLKRKYA